MQWITCMLSILSTFSFSGALLHGHTNASASSNEHTDPDVYKQLLQLETTLNSVYRELATLREQNLQQQKISEQQQQLIQTLNHTIQNLEDSLRHVKGENIAIKDRLDSLNSTFQVNDITKKLELQTQNLSLAIVELNKSRSEDIEPLRNILTFQLEQTIRGREQEVMKNVTSAISSLQLRDRYLSLSILDVQKNISSLGSMFEQQQRTQAKQHNLTQAEIQHLTYSFNNITDKLTSSLSILQKRADSVVAFTAGVGWSDNKTFPRYSTVIFKQVINQVGGGYNPNTGVFTAPKAGLYFIFSTAVAEARETFWTRIVINGSVKAGVMAHLGIPSLYVSQSASNLVVYQLHVGDRVSIQVDTGSHLYSVHPETTFSVVMIKGSD